MKVWRNSVQVFIGLWLLAGLAVLGINGYALMSLVDQPLAGYSDDVRQADRGFQQYRQLLSAETEKISSGMDHLVRRFTVNTPDIEPSVATVKEKTPSMAENTVKSTPVALPVLTGIVTNRSSTGRIHQLALLNDVVFAEGEMLHDFTIKKISADGVLLAKGKKRWFLRRPDIGYSLGQH